MILLELLFLAAGFALLIKGADFLVDGAGSIARRAGVRDIVIGLTVVAFGTSAPELVVNVFAAAGGNTALAVGNIIGSNIANILLILGASAAIYPLAVHKGTVWKEIPFTLLAALAVFFLLNDALIDGATVSILTRIDGLILLLFFAIFMYYSYGISKENGDEAGRGTPPRRSLTAAAMVAGGIIGLTAGGKIIVDNAVSLAEALGLSETLIGLTLVSIGTSLPELATSITAALKKKADIAIGNVVGSNIFNLFFVLAITSIIAPLPQASGINTDIAVMIGATAILFAVMFVGRRHILQRSQGILLLLLYAAYLAFAIMRG